MTINFNGCELFIRNEMEELFAMLLFNLKIVTVCALLVVVFSRLYITSAEIALDMQVKLNLNLYVYSIIFGSFQNNSLYHFRKNMFWFFIFFAHQKSQTLVNNLIAYIARTATIYDIIIFKHRFLTRQR